jgi:ABC-type transport system involved in multi-copper enzyme maturation permease subunit
MSALFRAEWQKITGYRMAALLLVWIYPIGAAIVMLLVLVSVLASDMLRQNAQVYPPNWTQQALGVWQIVNSEIGRFLIVIFASFVFAGEYQWGTWKNLIPRRGRAALILTKYSAFAVLMSVAVLLAVAIVITGTAVVSAVAGTQPMPALTDGAAVGDFAGDFALQGLTTLTVAIIAASYAALGGMLTRSILGGVLVGFLLQFAEQGVALVAIIAGQVFPALRGLYGLYLYTPSYNLANIGSIAQAGTPYFPYTAMSDLFSPNSLEASLLIVVLWVVGLVGLVTWLFRRQDILS